MEFQTTRVGPADASLDASDAVVSAGSVPKLKTGVVQLVDIRIAGAETSHRACCEMRKNIWKMRRDEAEARTEFILG